MIRVENVSHTYPNAYQSLANVNLHVGSGEFVSLLGPSGCGKSTLLKIVAHLLNPSSGQTLCDSQHLSFVFQAPALLPWKTTIQNVILPLELGPNSNKHDLSKKMASAQKVLDLVGLGEFNKAFPHELSGGMKMRASIARALISNPQILLMDEPFSALDEITKEALATDLLSLCKIQKPSVLFVTHNVYEAIFLSDRIYVMSERPGRIIDEFKIPFKERTPNIRHSAEFSKLSGQIHASLLKGFS